LTVPDLGENMAAVQGLLKKHDAFETDLSVHTDRCNEICSAGQKLIDDGNHHADSIVNRCDQVIFLSKKYLMCISMFFTVTIIGDIF
jgi:spectrin alpha